VSVQNIDYPYIDNLLQEVPHLAYSHRNVYHFLLLKPNIFRRYLPYLSRRPQSPSPRFATHPRGHKCRPHQRPAGHRLRSRA
jgi:hypothetical protein